MTFEPGWPPNGLGAYLWPEARAAESGRRFASAVFISGVDVEALCASEAADRDASVAASGAKTDQL